MIMYALLPSNTCRARAPSTNCRTPAAQCDASIGERRSIQYLGPGEPPTHPKVFLFTVDMNYRSVVIHTRTDICTRHTLTFELSTYQVHGRCIPEFARKRSDVPEHKDLIFRVEAEKPPMSHFRLRSSGDREGLIGDPRSHSLACSTNCTVQWTLRKMVKTTTM
jgi:hypothetical protein